MKWGRDVTKRDDASCVAAPVPPARERRGGTKPPKQTGSTRAAFGTLFEAVRSWEREGYCRTDVRGTFENLQFLILSLRARLGKLSLGDHLAQSLTLVPSSEKV